MNIELETVLYCYLNIDVCIVNLPQHEITREIDAVIPETTAS